jgi:signal transduction histidine kinase/ActR/RegA family two-component response regulator
MSENSNRRILVIDDNQAIHADFRKILSPDTGGSDFEKMSGAMFGETPNPPGFAGFEICSAFQGAEGLEMVKQSLATQKPFGVAFIDVRMPPGWDGIETTAKIWGVCPDLQVVICTAYSDYDWFEIARQLGQTDSLLILKKPFDTVEVMQLAETLANKWTLTRQARLRMADLDAVVNRRTKELSEAQEQLRQSQKLEAIGRLAGGIAHDFNNILAVIGGNAEMARIEADGLPGMVGECLSEISAASQRAANLTRQLLAFSRKQMMQSQPADLNNVITNLKKMLERIIAEHIDLQCHYASDLPLVQADIGMLEQVLVNLAINARDAMPDGGQLSLTTEHLILDAGTASAHPEGRPGAFVCVTVKDTGSGISPENLPRIFDPFFTTKAVGKGTGLGLATVYGIIKQHQGWIEVSSRLRAGSTFKFFLPALQCARPVSNGQTPQAGPLRGKETVLLVEDEVSVRAITRRHLEHSGYHVLEAGSAPEAMKVWEAAAPEVDLLLTDVIMPEGVSGRKLAQDLREKKPSLKVIFHSGYAGEDLGGNTEYFHRANSCFLQKPCPPQDLVCAVRRCLDDQPARREPCPVAA